MGETPLLLSARHPLTPPPPQRFNKQYEVTDLAMRRAIYERNVATIKAHNAEGHAWW